MVKFPCDYTKKELIERWDERTSVARFAGSDETMDLVFVSKRRDSRVKLMRRARSVRDPFASIFYGKIRSNEKGSEVVGFFAKSLLDYILIGTVLALLFYIRSCVVARGEQLETINTLLVVGIIGAVALVWNTRKSKRRYADFISEITGVPVSLFLSRREIKERENSTNSENQQ